MFLPLVSYSRGMPLGDFFREKPKTAPKPELPQIDVITERNAIRAGVRAIDSFEQNNRPIEELVADLVKLRETDYPEFLITLKKYETEFEELVRPALNALAKVRSPQDWKRLPWSTIEPDSSDEKAYAHVKEKAFHPLLAIKQVRMLDHCLNVFKILSEGLPNFQKKHPGILQADAFYTALKKTSPDGVQNAFLDTPMELRNVLEQGSLSQLGLARKTFQQLSAEADHINLNSKEVLEWAERLDLIRSMIDPTHKPVSESKAA